MRLIKRTKAESSALSRSINQRKMIEMNEKL